MKKALSFALALCMALSLCVVPSMAAGVAATKTASKVTVDGAAKSFDAYTIASNNYFKLRDIAMVLNGTAKQFEVTFDGAKNAIDLISGQPYTAVGGEMTPATGGASQTATASTAKIYVDGKETPLTAYTIAGNNYFKLRDLGATFDFGVEWDGAANSIAIKSTVGYTPEKPAAQKPANGVLLTASDFKYTKENGGITINKYIGSVYEGTIIIPSTIEGLPVLKLQRSSDEGYSAIYGNSVFPEFKDGTIGKYAHISEVVLPDTLIELGSSSLSMLGYADSSNPTLVSLTIPDSVTKIGLSALPSTLKYLKIGSGLSNLGEHNEGLGGTSELLTIEVSPDSPYFTSVDNVLFSKDMTELVRYPSGKSGKSYTVPSTVTKIGDNAFGMVGVDPSSDTRGNRLEEVVMGDGVQHIGYAAFMNDFLKRVVVPKTVVSSGGSVFNGFYKELTVVVQGELPVNFYFMEGATGTPAGTYVKTDGVWVKQ